MQNIPPFDATTLEEISKVLGEEASGTELTRLFIQINVKDDSCNTKWRRIYSVLSQCQQYDHSSTRVFQFIKAVLNPIRYTNHQERTITRYNQTLETINVLLSFSGYKITSNGEILLTKKTQNIEDALKHAQTFYRTLLERGTHAEVLKYCKPEALNDNYFHAVFEAIKGLNSRIKEMSGLDIDGVNLINTVFSEKTPYLAINSLRTQSEKDEHNGFRYLILGVQTMFRNPISHEAKINWEISGQDGLDILTTVSLIHRKLDQAVPIHRNDL